MPKPTQNTAYTFYASLVSQSDSHIFQANPTLAAGDVKVAIDDGAPANITTLPVVDADFTKRIKVSLSAAEMNCSNAVTVIFSDQSGAEWDDKIIDIHPETPRGEPGQGAPPESATDETKLDYLYKTFRNKQTNDGSFVNLFADDESTVDQKAAVSKSGGTTTRGEFVTGA